MQPEPASVKLSKTIRRTSRRLGALHLALASMFVLLVFGVLPSCEGGLCCPLMPDAPAVHSQMPCCGVESSFAPRDAVGLRPASFAGLSTSPQTWVPVALVERPGAEMFPSRVQATLATVSRARHEPSSPIFLSNAQLLI